MKKFMVGVAAAAALAAPSLANAETKATLGVQYTGLEIDNGFDYDAYSLDGAFNHDLNNGWQVQADGAASRIDIDGCCINQNFAAVHYGKRTDTHSFAGYVGFQDFFLYSGLTLGVEGQMHFSNVSLGGSISYVDFGDINLDGASGHLDGAYFINPNFALTGVYAYSDYDGLDGSMWGVGSEYRFADSPASLTIGYRQNDLDSTDTDAWTIGVNFDFGTGSLQERREHGPSWSGARTLSDAFGMIFPLP